VAWRQDQQEKNIYGLSFNWIDESEKEGLGRYIGEKFHNLVVKHWWEGPNDA
jgi:hypothetical protein